MERPTGAIDTETRWNQARWLLHDDTVKPEDRVAGLLVLLYAQPTSRIVRLTLDHVHTSDTEVRLQLGREPVLLPEPLAGLIRQAAATSVRRRCGIHQPRIRRHRTQRPSTPDTPT